MKNPLKLINKYNVPVPRYTSYPPANHFIDISADEVKNAIIESNDDKPENISIYLHIPFCKKMCLYCGCNSCPFPEENEVKSYYDALLKELSMVIPLLDKSRKLSQIHYGGGTPNSIPMDYILELNKRILSDFDTIPNPEIAIECNPAYMDKNAIDNISKAGFNRISLGVQDFNPVVLKNVNRDSPLMPIEDIITYIKELNSDTVINLDFIYGLPGQTTGSFLKTIEKAVLLKPDRLVTFSYAHVPWVNKRQLVLEKKGLPTQSEKMDMFFRTYDLLKQMQYKPLGLDHYVLENDELYKAFKNNELHRNFQGYCTRRTTGQVYAFGASAISQMASVYAQNAKTSAEYIHRVNSGKLPAAKGYQLNQEEKIIRDVINDLMCNKFLDFNIHARNTGISVNDLKKFLINDESVIRAFESDELINYFDDKIEVKEQGVLFIRNIAASLDPNYKYKLKKYSKSV